MSATQATTTRGALRAAFTAAAADSRAALIPYLMCGAPSCDATVELALACVRGGADAIELGMPFSDPLADGPTIQRAGTEALANGTDMRAVLDVVRRVREQSDVPLVLMGYSNPVMRFGIEKFCADAATAGANGLIIADLPPEEATELRDAAHSHRLDVVFLVAPTSDDQRVAEVARMSSGYLYCVALTGVTGARSGANTNAQALLERVRAQSDLPVAIGFGISTPDHVRAVAPHADGVIVGSALIELIAVTPETEHVVAVENFVRSLAEATRRGQA